MRTIRFVLCVLLCAGAAATMAAPPKNAVLMDHSSATLIDGDSARAVLAEGVPARAWKLYPANRWGYVSQVEGGFTASGQCVVTARVMLMPLTPTLKAMLFRPAKTATAFDTQAGISQDQCKQLAKTKLQEALTGVVSSLVKL